MSKPLALHGIDLFGDPVKPFQAPLAERFLVPPFSVLDARQGFWQERKRGWLALGIQSELGRGDDMALAKVFGKGLTSGTGNYAKSKFAKCLETGIGEKYGRKEMTGTSIFDPVLCELMYQWFCPEGGTVLDPFAGGSVRGLVASKLGLRYVGVDLSSTQVQANREQGNRIYGKTPPMWIVGDSSKDTPAVKADMIFSCPPYGSLERYSDLPQDLSTMEWPVFLSAYQKVIQKAAARLKPNRFACFVVGVFRNKSGFYCDLVGETVQAFEKAGLRFYNDAILVTAIGSLPIRSTRFNISRKVGKTHQNILVFVKGDWKKAAMLCKQDQENEVNDGETY